MKSRYGAVPGPTRWAVVVLVVVGLLVVRGVCIARCLEGEAPRSCCEGDPRDAAPSHECQCHIVQPRPLTPQEDLASLGVRASLRVSPPAAGRILASLPSRPGTTDVPSRFPPASGGPDSRAGPGPVWLLTTSSLLS